MKPRFLSVLNHRNLRHQRRHQIVKTDKRNKGERSVELIPMPSALLTFRLAEASRGRSSGASEHTAPFDALVQVAEGETEIVISA